MSGAQTLKVGPRLLSQVCTTEVIVVKVGPDLPVLMCGGSPMVAPSESPDPNAVIGPDWADGSPLGKRFTGEGLDLEVLVVKAGAGRLGGRETAPCSEVRKAIADERLMRSFLRTETTT